MEVMVFGAGYVGLVQAAGLASTGNRVYLVDINKERVDSLRAGECPIHEPGLKGLLNAGAEKSYLHFIHNEDAEFQELLERSEVYFLAIQTPEAEDGMPQLNYLMSAVDTLVEMKSDLSGKFVVVKSTVPVGTGDKIEERLKKSNKKAIVVSNPEFLKQGSAVQDFMKPERVILGANESVAFEVLSFLHRPFMMKRERIVCISRRSAELVKYACNAFLATKISFINEMSQLAEKVGANIQEIREGMITDSRIGDQFLFPGIGYGGSCLPKDTHALAAQADKIDLNMGIIKAVDAVNKTQRTWALRKLKEEFKGDFSNKTIAVWGLAFKPNTDDLREAPSLELLTEFLNQGATIQAHDPAAMKRFQVAMENHPKKANLRYTDSPYQAVEGADALILMTEWQEYRTPSFAELSKRMKAPVLLDGRDIYEPKIVTNAGFKYYGVGIPLAS